MDVLARNIEIEFIKKMRPNKVTILLGPRRIGKTILLKNILSNTTEPYLFLNGEDLTTHKLLARRSVEHYKTILGTKLLLVIDEAQNIPDIGNILKLMIDEIIGLRILITGSSAFDIENKTGEPLTGRKITLRLYPISESEYQQIESPLTWTDGLRHRLIYGNYPELLHIDDQADKTRYLNELVFGYLMKYILALENIRNSDKIVSLLRLLAFQVGSLVSTSELAQKLGMSVNTVSKYLDLLTKVFVIHRVGGFSRNLRKEITKSNQWFFYDNGIRNILIANMNPLELRNDQGLLWENYIISERLKYQSYTGLISNNYFWRTYDQQEIDWIEDRGGQLHAYEFKWNPKKKTRAPKGWERTYPDATYQVIHPENYRDWVIGDFRL